MIRAIIFDCFGVLVGRGFDHTYRTAGGNPLRDRAFIETTLGQANLGLINNTEFAATMAHRLAMNPSDWSRAIRNAEILNVDLLEYITELHVSYKTAILSNANKRVLHRKIGEQWLDKIFDVIVVSAEVGIAKPDLQIYQLVVDRLEVAPNECLYIDDRESFLTPASQLGMSVLRYENFDQIKHDISELLG